jgi:hypothetical protein
VDLVGIPPLVATPAAGPPGPPARAGTNREAQRRRRRYRRALLVMKRTGIPFLVGGGYALRHYAGGVRGTKDIDVFVRRRDAVRLLRALSADGFETDLTFPHWLGKARVDGSCIDIIFSSGNRLAEVDDAWFTHSVEATVLRVPVRLCPAEEMIWSKAFVMERERYDGNDVSHLIRACGARLDWRRLVTRFGPHWRVLLSHLILFGFIYPGERGRVPADVMLGLCRLLEDESRWPTSGRRLCQGTLLSREQYLADVFRWGYTDARVRPNGPMTTEEVSHWTAAIRKEKGDKRAAGGGR